MPTFKSIVGKLKEDETYPISIQVTHRRDKRYIPTSHFVVKRQVKTKAEIKYIKGEKKTISNLLLKDDFVIDAIDSIIKGYRKRLLAIPDLNNVTVDEIKAILIKPDQVKDVDFIEFGREFIKTQVEATGKNTEIVLNSFTDFLGRNSISIHQINLKLLNAFSAYLTTYRENPRLKNKDGSFKILKPLTDTGVRDYLGKLRQIFKAARDQYNNEETGIVVIPHYPFGKLKMPKAAKSKKRNVKYPIIKLIRDCPDVEVGKYGRKTLSAIARDVFMLSFYLVGANLVDLYKINTYENGRLSYRRSKTESRKGEDALISIKVEPEVLPLLEKYKDETGERIFNFYKMYHHHDRFTSSVNDGLVHICNYIRNQPENEDIILPKITAKYARASWSTIARNVCKVSKDDIQFALNHSNPDFKVTDIYIEEDFKIIDEANRMVIDTLL